MTDRRTQIYDQALDTLLTRARHHFWAVIEDARWGCESPIEELMAIAMTTMDPPLYRGGDMDIGLTRVLHAQAVFNENAFRNSPTEILAGFKQQQVLDYRVDFLIAARFGSKPGDVHKIVVECDGHDFHERTKEQAERDRRRDREMTAAGYKVFRFTGAEIYRDPFACAAEVRAFLHDLSHKAMDE